MKKHLVALIAFISLSMSGCSIIDNNIKVDKDLQKKAAFALGTTPEKIKITNRGADIMKVTFNATFKKRVFQCYYTGGVIITSDAICSATDGKAMPATSQCNALLKAAGKC
ncbi:MULTISPECIES: hypothetical protein [Aliivibrio]|uniref:Lipoprotein n=1 Tax=Aliivibrio finisterrensis TaxID=511998 RepID=A0A4Q5KX52_9GAMM|nr:MULTISPECIES: hypothetical protein [Aliivibrio]MDD9178013.1 hypothetical protein [Aliivibrio sp. A6]RYU51971.1 hypothetical protein ERW56_11285 [Aliivibrio finisterrensis]RYU53698.1 hypothetical protein ERW57_03870 [Aliivibrio finisterrensis]RYU57685.1 hypothetical protein ERW50_10695 [Aliivibrio finisterrensis]RYU66143.1 hypothetical protein ERW53_04400 [Aliivibrio finisterrensis]